MRYESGDIVYALRALYKDEENNNYDFDGHAMKRFYIILKDERNFSYALTLTSQINKYKKCSFLIKQEDYDELNCNSRLRFDYCYRLQWYDIIKKIGHLNPDDYKKMLNSSLDYIQKNPEEWHSKSMNMLYKLYREEYPYKTIDYYKSSSPSSKRELKTGDVISSTEFKSFTNKKNLSKLNKAVVVTVDDKNYYALSLEEDKISLNSRVVFLNKNSNYNYIKSLSLMSQREYLVETILRLEYLKTGKSKEICKQLKKEIISNHKKDKLTK